MSPDAAPRPTRAQLVGVGVFTAAYLIAATVVALLRGNQEFVFYIVTMLFIVAGVAFVHRRVGLTTATLWALSLWGLLHMAGGLVPLPESGVLYNWWLIPGRLKYDQVVHAYGFAVTTWVCWQTLRPYVPTPRTQIGPYVIAAAGGMGFGALNEVVEFAATLLVPETNVGGYVNTGWDLVANMVGCVTAAVLLAISERRLAA